MKRTLFALLLALAMIAAFVLVPMPTDIKANAATVTSTNLVSNIQDGVTLQCWNWSIANIKANLGLIANSGYSAIQVSPMQEMKEGTVNKPVNNWWAVYQPISFYINESQSHCVGTKDELIDRIKDLCSVTTTVYEDKPNRSALHPTMKPLGLFKKQIRNSSREGENVLDLFGGSGATLIACEDMHRRCFMMEYDPH